MAVSSDGVVTASILGDGATVKLVVDFTVSGSPITSTAATTVYSVAVTEQTSGNLVRGISTAPGGVIVGVDHESPFAVGLSYLARAYDVAGNLLATSAAVSLTVPIPATGMGTWLKSLATPSASVNVQTSVLPEWSADIAQSVIQVIGRPDPVVVQDIRQFETGTLEVLTRTTAAETALKTLLRSPGPYLLQMPSAGTVDKYVMVGKHSRKRTSNQFADPNRVWTLPLTQVVRPPVNGWSVAIPGHTYADSQAAAATYAFRTGTYESRAL